MTKILKITISVFIFIALSTNVFAVDENVQGTGGSSAAKVGTAGSQFLKIPFGARGAGMGGAYGAVCNDLSSIYWNPAGLADLKSISAEFNFAQYFATYSHSATVVSLPLSQDFNLAVHMVSFSSGNIPITSLEVPEGPGATYQVQDMTAGLTLSGFLTQEFSFGITAKYVSNSIYNVSSGGIAFDIGTMYNTNIYGIKVAFSIQNLGAETSYEGQGLRSTKSYLDANWATPLDVSYIAYPYSYPLIFRAGISSEVFKQDDHKVIAAFDFTTFSDVPEQFSVGAEYTYSDFVALRAGYQFNQDQLGLAAGIGIKYDGEGFSGKFDYSINPSFNLGLINRFTIGIGF